MKTISLEVLTQQNYFFLQECFTQMHLLVTNSVMLLVQTTLFLCGLLFPGLHCGT